MLDSFATLLAPARPDYTEVCERFGQTLVCRRRHETFASRRSDSAGAIAEHFPDR
jgi:hypothetical protein